MENKEKFYQTKWFTIIMLIFIAPVGIILMYVNKHWDSKTRKILSVVFGLFFIIVAITSQPTEEEKAEEEALQEQAEQDKEKKDQAEKEKKDEEKKVEDDNKKLKEEVAKEREEGFNKAVENWEDYKKDLLDHYGEVEILDIQENPESDFDIVNVYVPNEYKLSSDNEKEYYVEEVGPLIRADLTDYFRKDHDVAVYFLYQDGNTMASPKALSGGWKIK